MTLEFGPEDIDRLTEVLRLHPQGEEIMASLSDWRALQEVANKLKYPVNSFGELVRQLEPGKSMKIGRTEMKVSEMRKMIPAWYFPIASKEDFFDKASELIKEHKVDVNQGVQMPLQSAQPIPPEILQFKGPDVPPPEGGIGYRKEDIDRALTGGGGG